MKLFAKGSKNIQKEIQSVISKHTKKYGISDGLTLIVVNKYCMDGEDISEMCMGCDSLHGPQVIMYIDEHHIHRIEFYESVKKDPYFVKRGIPVILQNKHPPREMYI